MTSPVGGTAARRAARERAASSKTSRTTNSTSGSGSTGGRTPSRRDLDPDRLVALEEERDFLLRSLEDLEREHDAGDVDDADYEALKDDYTARAATVIRSIDDRNAAVRSSRPTRDWRRTALGLVMVAVLAVGAGWLVFRNAGTRAPGQGLTGDARQDSANLILRAEGYTGQAQTALQAGDTTKALQDWQLAVDTYSKVLELAPKNVKAITYRAWVQHSLALRSEPAQAVELDAQSLAGLSEAIGIDPTYADARVFRAILEKNLGDYEAAQADLDAVDMTRIPPYMTSMVDSVRRDVAAGSGGS